jgi:hypothetical protein
MSSAGMSPLFLTPERMIQPFRSASRRSHPSRTGEPSVLDEGRASAHDDVAFGLLELTVSRGSRRLVQPLDVVNEFDVGLHVLTPRSHVPP